MRDEETAYTGETVSGDAEWALTLRAAAQIGRDLGTAQGSWIVDGNTSAATLQAVIQASDEGEFYTRVMPDASGPLSMEWADGYTLPRLADDLGIDQEHDGFDDACTALEDAYWTALEDEAVRSARAMLPDDAPGAYNVAGAITAEGSDPAPGTPEGWGTEWV